MALDDTLQMPAHGGAASAALRKRATQGFWAVLVGSVALHVGALGGYMYLETLKPKPRRLERAIPVQLVKLGVRKDPKLLPRIDTVAPPPPPSEGVALETKPKDPNEKQKPPDPKTKQKEPELSKAAQRLLDSQPSNLDRAMSRISAKPEAPEGDPDGDIHGTTSDPNAGVKGYERDVSRALTASYRLPETIPASQRQFLRASVILYIRADGRVDHYEFVERHPNPAFMSALEVMLRSVTLPPPPKDKAARYAQDGLEVVFRP